MPDLRGIRNFSTRMATLAGMPMRLRAPYTSEWGIDGAERICDVDVQWNPPLQGTAVRISIAMATYNGAKYIRDQLDTLARQSLPPVELVVTDDGSTDATLSIVEEFLAVAPFPVHVFRNATRLGYEENFLKAASLCTGDWIAFCDQDDLWMEHKLSLCSQYFADTSIQGVIHTGQTMRDYGERGDFVPYFPKTKVLEAGGFNPLTPAPGFAMVIRRDLLDLLAAPDRPSSVRGHDSWCWLLASSAGAVVTIADVLVLYRQHDANTFGAPPQRSLLEAIRFSAGVQDFAEEVDFGLVRARILEAAAQRDPNRANPLLKSARKFRYRARLYGIRSSLYTRQSTFLTRAGQFARLCWLGGYFPDRSGARLGFKCGMKDFFFGVSGLYKLVESTRSAKTDADPG